MFLSIQIFNPRVLGTGVHRVGTKTQRRSKSKYFFLVSWCLGDKNIVLRHPQKVNLSKINLSIVEIYSTFYKTFRTELPDFHSIEVI